MGKFKHNLILEKKTSARGYAGDGVLAMGLNPICAGSAADLTKKVVFSMTPRSRFKE